MQRRDLPLWLAAFQLAAESIAADEAAPVASCSILATEEEARQEYRKWMRHFELRI